MTNNAKKITEEIEEVTEGIKRIDVVELPPKIKWGDDFKAWDDQKKIKYLMKFGEAMNHAADVVQKERDELGRMAEIKEDRINQLESMLEDNNKMLLSEITRMNEYRQEVNKESARLHARIRELESA